MEIGEETLQKHFLLVVLEEDARPSRCQQKLTREEKFNITSGEEERVRKTREGVQRRERAVRRREERRGPGSRGKGSGEGL